MIGFSTRLDLSALPFILPVEIAPLSVTVTPGDTFAVIEMQGEGTGMFHWYLGATDATPTKADLIAGTGALQSGAVLRDGFPRQGTGPANLTPDTGYFLFAMVAGPTDSAIRRVDFTTLTTDLTQPILSAPTLDVVDAATLAPGVSSDTASGEISLVLTETATAPDPAQIEAGTDHEGGAALAAATQAVSAAGRQPTLRGADGLAAGVPHHAHFVQRSGGGILSAVVSAGPAAPADVTAPVISSPEIVATGPDTVRVSFNTDSGEGTAFVLVQPGTDPLPDPTAVRAAQAMSVTAPGVQTLDVAGLAELTGYLAYILQTDIAGNESPVAAAPEPAVTESSTQIAVFHRTGQADGAVLTRLDLDQSFDHGDGTNAAILLRNMGTGTGSETVMYRTPGNSITFNAGPNVLRAEFRSVAAPGKFWLRLLVGDVASGPGTLSLDVTDDGTAAAARVGNPNGWTNVTLTPLANGRLAVEAHFDMTGSSDTTGRLQINLSDTNGGGQLPNTVPDAYQLALHALIISTV